MEAPPFFGHVIAREVWEPIQAQLAAALRMEVHAVGADGLDLCEPSGLTPFRRLLATSRSFNQALPIDRRKLVDQARRSRRIVMTETMTGRLRFGVPIIAGGEPIAIVTGGGVVCEPMSEPKIVALANRFGVPLDPLREAAGQLTVVEHAQLLAAARLINSLLAQIVKAVDLRRQAELRARRLKILTEVGQAVTGSLDLLRILDTVAAAVPRVMQVKAAVVALTDDDSHSLRIRAGHGISEEFMRVRFQPGLGLIGHVAVSGEPINVPDMLADPRNAYVEHDRREGLRALLAMPLRDGDRILGVIGAFHGQPHSFTGGDEDMLATLADYAATAVRNARLYEQVTQAYRELGVSTRRLHDMQEKLFQSDRLALLGRMAGDTAHEVKNTLGGIIGAASTVRDHLHRMNEDEVRELLAAIAEEGWRLKDQLDAVRSYAKPAHYGSGEHSVTDSLEDAVRLLRFDRSLEPMEFVVECPSELRYRGDRDRVKQVLLNLLRNAVEATPAEPEVRPRIILRANASAEQVRIQIVDNGIGIASEDVSRIWEPFYTTKGQAGTGLGLDNVRQIVRALGGDVEVDSEVGVGTTFTVTLPRAQPATGKAESI